MIFAAAFDRVLPGVGGARLRGPRRAVDGPAADHGPGGRPVVAVRLPGRTFSALTLDASLVIAVTFFGTSIAATILPWWKPDLYKKSPIARYKIGGAAAHQHRRRDHDGLPRLGHSTSGCRNALYGIGVGNSDSIKFLAFLYGLAAVLYVVARLVRRAQGINLDAIHAEIPAE